MAGKVMLSVLAAIALTQSTHHEAIKHDPHGPHRHHHERQNFDSKSATNLPALTLQAHATMGSSTGVPTPQPAQIETQPEHHFDLDIPTVENPFSTNEINQLIATGSSIFESPNGELVEVQLVKHRQQFGMDHIQAQIAGNVATITQRGEHFYATLALPSASYRLEGNASGSRIYPHQLIAARTIQHETDYRHAP